MTLLRLLALREKQQLPKPQLRLPRRSRNKKIKQSKPPKRLRISSQRYKRQQRKSSNSRRHVQRHQQLPARRLSTRRLSKQRKRFKQLLPRSLRRKKSLMLPQPKLYKHKLASKKSRKSIIQKKKENTTSSIPHLLLTKRLPSPRQ